jgi:hypothetical protein
MEFRNYTPFPALAFASVVPGNQRFQTVVLRQTFVLRAGVLVLDQAQSPLVTADQYFGEPNASSVKAESDLAPYKPRCDVVICADAHAPGDLPVPQFNVGVGLARPGGQMLIEHWLRVTGPRELVRSNREWALSAPQPFKTLAMRYEHAWGGQCRVEDDDGAVQHTGCEANPIGAGFAESWYLDAIEAERLAAPRVESPTAPFTAEAWHAALEGKSELAPGGLGVVGRAWQPRLKLAGTYDDAWLESRHPGLPDDFDFGHWNGAHPMLQVPHLKGNESLVLVNLVHSRHPQARADSQGNTRLVFRLPGHLPMGWAYTGETLKFAPLLLDTLHVDLTAEEPRVALTWRATVPGDTQRFEARFIDSEELGRMTTAGAES